jgi:hypothetical protein
MFHPFPAGQVQHYYTALARLGRRDEVEAALGLPAGSVALSLLQLDARISRPIREGTLRFRPMAGGHPRGAFCRGQVRINYLTPVPQTQYAYASAVEGAVRRIFDDGPVLRPADSLPQPAHNLASGAVLVEYGTTRALLMADAEDRLWEDWLATGPSPDLRQKVHFLKVAHHGSRNGYHARLFADVGDCDKTVAVLTPFNQGSVHLPTEAGVLALRSHVRDLYCTNRTSAGSSTGLLWDSVPFSLPRLPARWTIMIRRRRTLGRLLVPEAGIPTVTGGMPLLPPEWIADAHSNPALWRLILPSERPPLPSPETVDDHTISAYFDNCGNLVNLNVGVGAGHLAA